MKNVASVFFALLFVVLWWNSPAQHKDVVSTPNMAPQINVKKASLAQGDVVRNQPFSGCRVPTDTYPLENAVSSAVEIEPRIKLPDPADGPIVEVANLAKVSPEEMEELIFQQTLFRRTQRATKAVGNVPAQVADMFSLFPKPRAPKIASVRMTRAKQPERDAAIRLAPIPPENLWIPRDAKPSETVGLEF